MSLTNQDSIAYGASIEITAEPFNADGTSGTASAATFSTRNPETGVVTDYVYGVATQVTHPAGNRYIFKSPALNAVGAWAFRFESSGGVVTAAEVKVKVRPSAFT